MKLNNVKLILYFSIYASASWLCVVVENSLFNGLEIVLSIALVGLLIGFCIHQRKDPLKIYTQFEDDRKFFRRQRPDLYAACCLIIIGVLCLYTAKGESFETEVTVVDKYKSLFSRTPAYVLQLQDNSLGTLRRRVSKAEWLKEQQSGLVSLKVRQNILGFHLVTEHRILSK
ncbi:hypothetical protein APQ14_19565 [Vibrio toranzoniae]|uniref:Uncharacterized protein n=1 Tax=Vibrio toranzoniae TaxID=1194427 RepID=A0A109D4U0_9VIBR|nr:hypothetical protein [Vibrio toranzoniae]KWT98936.1 hypothetical protein APQ14_19565 [Vibrio toranzoniae]